MITPAHEKRLRCKGQFELRENSRILIPDQF